MRVPFKYNSTICTAYEEAAMSVEHWTCGTVTSAFEGIC